MPQHVSMDPRDLVTQLEHLDLTLADVVHLTGADERYCALVYAGVEPIPHGLHLLTVIWEHDARALYMSHEVADAMEQGGPTSGTVGETDGIAVFGATMD